jgi:hypothetical protein
VLTVGNHLHALGQAVLEPFPQQLCVQLPADEDHAAGAGLALPPRPRRRPLEQAVHALQGATRELMSAPGVQSAHATVYIPQHITSRNMHSSAAHMLAD